MNVDLFAYKAPLIKWKISAAFTCICDSIQLHRDEYTRLLSELENTNPRHFSDGVTSHVATLLEYVGPIGERFKASYNPSLDEPLKNYNKRFALAAMRGLCAKLNAASISPEIYREHNYDDSRLALH